MKRHIILTVFLSLYCPLIYSQSFIVKTNDDFGEGLMYLDSYPYPMTVIDQERIRVVYECGLNFRDDSERKLSSRYVLQIGTRKTKFMSEIRFRADSLLYNGSSVSQAARLYDGKANQIFSQDCFLLDMGKRSLTFTGRLVADDFLFSEILEPVDWVIRPSYKTICGYRCQLAEGVFRGRVYQVWFAGDLPSPAGPWKLRGLPGVILSASDIDHNVSFQAVCIFQNGGDMIWSEYPYIKVDRDKYLKLLDQYFKNPALFVSNHLGRSGWTARLSEDHAPRPYPRPIQLEK